MENEMISEQKNTESTKKYLEHKETFKQLSIFDIIIRSLIILLILASTFSPFLVCEESIKNVELSSLEEYAAFFKTLSEEEIISGVFKKSFSIFDDLSAILRAVNESLDNLGAGMWIVMILEEATTAVFGLLAIILAALNIYKTIKKFGDEDDMMLKYDEFKKQSIERRLNNLTEQSATRTYTIFLVTDIIFMWFFKISFSALSGATNVGYSSSFKGLNGLIIFPILFFIAYVVVTKIKDKKENELKIKIIKENEQSKTN